MTRQDCWLTTSVSLPQSMSGLLTTAVECSAVYTVQTSPPVTCHMSHVTCHMSHVTCHMFIKNGLEAERMTLWAYICLYLHKPWLHLKSLCHPFLGATAVH